MHAQKDRIQVQRCHSNSDGTDGNAAFGPEASNTSQFLISDGYRDDQRCWVGITQLIVIIHF